jgi:hypothetical protein
MNFIDFLNAKTKKMDWLDIGLVKFSCIVFGILLAVLIPRLLEINVWLLIILALLFGIRPIYRAYFKKD